MHPLTNQAKAATNRSYPKYSSFKRKGVIKLSTANKEVTERVACASYEETIGKITGIRWERETTDEKGVFSRKDTGRLIIFTDGAQVEDLLKTSYLSFLRKKEGQKDDEWPTSIREILIKKFAPEKEPEVYQRALGENSSAVIPLPIMLADKDEITIYRPTKGKVRGITFRIETSKMT
jgi:hypothetical protein